MRILQQRTCFSNSLTSFRSPHISLATPSYVSDHYRSPMSSLHATTRPYVATLDDKFIPSGLFPSTNTGRLILVATVFIAIALAQNFWDENLANYLQFYKRKFHQKKSLFKKLCVKSLKKIGAILHGIFKFLVPTLPIDGSEISTSTRDNVVSSDAQANSSLWKTCTLERKDILNDRFMFYKFKLNGPAPKFGIGKKVVLCSVDERGNPVKEEFYPTVFQMDRNHLGVVSRIFKRSNDDKLSTLLPSLAYGDEIAFKPGPNVLQYKGSENPIKFLTIVASGTGIIPILDILKRVLNDDEFEVDSCELLWINDSKEDFIFNNEIEKLENAHGDRFFCARVLDEDITTEESVLNDKVRDSLPLAEPGRVAIVAAPATVANKFKPALDSLIYQQQNVMSIPV